MLQFRRIVVNIFPDIPTTMRHLFDAFIIIYLTFSSTELFLDLLGSAVICLRPPHFFLPNFADSIGPVKVVQAEPEELGGGASHPRKLVVTKDVEARACCV